LNDNSVSVIIPSYNYKNFLPQAVESVAFQTYTDIELIIVDDASSDGSAELINELSEKYSPRFSSIRTIFNQTNEGAHAAINKGITNSSGKYITILNADDMYEKGRISLMLGSSGGASLIFSSVLCIDADGKRIDSDQARQFESIQKKLSGKRFTALAALGENLAISTGNMMFTRKLFDELGGFKNYKYVHDYDFFLRACLITEPSYIPETAYLYRLHGKNSFTKLAKEGVRENRMVWLDIYGRIKRGEVKNPLILKNPGFIDEFKDAAASEGKKKTQLWKLAGSPLSTAALGVLKKRYGVD